jgi:hypothetical protein
MQLQKGLHLAYCTNVHPGEEWAQTLAALERWTLRVRERVHPHGPYAIGLRLSDQSSRDLSDPATLLAFQRWLEKHNCYVFTINGFPFGRFHGTRVKEQVYLPDWTSPERLEYTNRLFDLLAQLLPPGLEGSVSTLPGSFKDFIVSRDQEAAIRANLWRCVEHIAETSRRNGRALHLGLEPEPFGYFENSPETVRFFERMREEHPNDQRLNQHLGVNYDTCHFAVAFEEPEQAITRLKSAGIKLSKIHISNALKLQPTPDALRELSTFAEDVYLHQVNVRAADGSLTRYKDLDLALQTASGSRLKQDSEWRVHFHVPLHSSPVGLLGNTQDHILGLMRILQDQPSLCSHLEMETYTWAVLPSALKTCDVVEQISNEYDWTLQRLAENGLSTPQPGSKAPKLQTVS